MGHVDVQIKVEPETRDSWTVLRELVRGLGGGDGTKPSTLLVSGGTRSHRGRLYLAKLPYGFRGVSWP